MSSTKALTIMFVVLLLLEATLCSYGRAIIVEDMKGLRLKSGHDELTSVEKFAQHALCSHMQGQTFFYQALKEKLCKVKDVFIITMVTELCARRDSRLERWVAEVFDINGDGYIASMEVDAHTPKS